MARLPVKATAISTVYSEYGQCMSKMEEQSMSMEVKSGIFGLAVADALGVPVEFMEPSAVEEKIP